MEHLLLLGELYSLIHAHDGFEDQSVDEEARSLSLPTMPPTHTHTPRAGNMLAAGLGEAGAGRRVDKADQGRRGKMDARAGTFFIIFPTEANALTLASQPPGV